MRKAVAIPPPFFYGTALVLGLLAHRALAWHIPLPRAVSMAAGTLLAVIGLALSVIVSWLFVRARTPISPLSQPTALVLAGPYRFSRNPDYIGQTLLCAGLGLLFDAPLAIVGAIAAFVLVDRTVVPREERYLEQRFGEPYRQYRRRVPRWL